MLNKSFNYFSYYQWWKNLDKFILSLIITLFLIGLFFSLVSTSLIASDKLETNSYFFFFKHLVFVIIGLVIIFTFSYMDLQILYKTSIFQRKRETQDSLFRQNLAGAAVNLKLQNSYFFNENKKSKPTSSAIWESPKTGGAPIANETRSKLPL